MRESGQELTFLYVHGLEIGYARAGTMIARELEKRGVTVWDDDGQSLARTRGSRQRKVAEGHKPPPSPTNAMCWVSVPTHAKGWYDGQHRSILTMWEARSLPEAFRDTIHEFELVMVPSYQNVELFSKYHDNVQLVLLGVDPEVWHYHEPPPITRTFDFLIAGRGARKGIDVAYEAFAKVFGHWWTYDEDGPRYVGPSDRPEPRLIIKSLKAQDDYYTPFTKHVVGRLEGAEEAHLYASCHAYVQPSRGEGFGLQPLQAIATGRPTILTNAHGHESYAHLGIPITAHSSDAAYFIYGGHELEWWEPDLEETCEAIWDVYENYDQHKIMAAQSAAEVAENWTWSNSADQFMEHMAEPISQPYLGSGKWIEAERKLFKIITIEDHQSHAAGVFRQFKKGEVYYDLADIKRVLYDAGKLDPACLDENDPDSWGLAPEQVDSVPEYNAARAYCWTCQQRLNTKPTRSDDIMAGLAK